jgi:transcription elongation factor GreA
MFKKTLDRLEAELKELQRRLTVDIPKELNTAAALGDLSENAEYHAAKDKKKITETRLSLLKSRIRELTSIDLSKVSKTKSGLGSLVTVEDLNTGEEKTWELVLADSVDVEAGRISLQAPIGRALMGREKDDEVSVVLPAGKKEFIINRIVTIHERGMA